MLPLLVAIVPAALPAQEATAFLVSPAADGVALRWVWPEGRRPLGYHVERRESGTGWTRLTAQPVARVRQREAAYALLREAYERYESLLFPDDPLAELHDPESSRSLLLLLADVEPGVARVLGLRFDDTVAARGGRYEYRLIALTDAGEREAARGGPVIAGSFAEVPPPDSLRVAQAADGVTLTWSTTRPFSAYHVFRRRGRTDWARVNGPPVVVFAADGPIAIQAPWFFIDTAAVAGDTLGYAVAGVDPFGRISRRSPEARIAVRDVKPPAPPLQVSTAVNGDTVAVSWVPSPDPTVSTYRVWRASSSEGPFEPIGSPLPASAHGLRDSGGATGRVWWYRVTAQDRTGNESEPSFVAIAVLRDVTPPPPPAGLTAVPDTGRIALTWQPLIAADLRGYRVYRASTPEGTFGLMTATPVPAASYVDTIPRGADHAFHYRVTAVDSAFNESVPSPVLAAHPPDARAPSAPRIEWVRPCEDCLAVRWFANPERDVTAYRVRYRPQGDSAWRDVAAAALPVATLDTIRGLEPRRLYEVTVVAVDDAGNVSAPARAVAGEPLHRRPPPPLAVRRATYDPRARAVLVEWSPPQGAVERVRVVRRDRTTGTVETLGAAASQDGRFVDRRAEAGRRYEYAVRAVDRFGNMAEAGAWRRVDVPGETR